MYVNDEIDSRSKDNVRENGEVFTPSVIVEDMLDLIPGSAWSDPEYVFLEPTCGNGQFVAAVFKRRLMHMDAETAANTIIGLDISKVNIRDTKRRMHEIARGHLLGMGLEPGTKKWNGACRRIAAITANNIRHVADSLPLLESGNLKMKYVFNDPSGYGQAMSCSQRDKWLAAIDKAFALHREDEKSNPGLSPFCRED